MPIWHVHHPENLYSTKDKQQFAAQVTVLYAELIKLPKFYVSVAFHAFAPQDFFVGAEPATKFVRISIDHIARLTPDPERRKKWMDTINERLTPFLRHRGVHWEIHIDETPRDFWTIDGFFPPPTGSSDERRWAEENKPSQPIGGRPGSP